MPVTLGVVKIQRYHERGRVINTYSHAACIPSLGQPTPTHAFFEAGPRTDDRGTTLIFRVYPTRTFMLLQFREGLGISPTGEHGFKL